MAELVSVSRNFMQFFYPRVFFVPAIAVLMNANSGAWRLVSDDGLVLVSAKNSTMLRPSPHTTTDVS
jgi:hypothetical protein